MSVWDDEEDDGYGPDDDEEETRGLNDAENPESDF